MKLPEFPVEGGCLCGEVRYRIGAAPLGIYNCHCKDCQRSSGATHSMSMVMRAEDFAHTAGEPSAYDKLADSGRTVRQFSCGRCGTRVFHRPLASPDMVVVRAGTLDDFTWARPAGNIWTESRAPWVEIDPAMVNFAGQPPSREPLFAAWQALAAEVEDGAR